MTYHVVTSWDAVHQYDVEGIPIAKWHEKSCSWMKISDDYNLIYEIDSQGSTDISRTIFQKELEDYHPDWKENPDIHVEWTFDKEEWMETFGYDEDSRKWGSAQKFQYIVTRQWGYLEYDQEEAIKNSARYCGWHENASNVKVYYDNQIIFNGKPESLPPR